MTEIKNEPPSMTPKELYDYILKFMPAEEALLKLLSHQIRIYDNLKRNKPLLEEDGTDVNSVNPIFIITAAAMDLGWDLLVERGNPEDDVRGLAVGTDEYIEDLSNNPSGTDALLDSLYEAIKHGDENHQKWIKNTIDSFRTKSEK